MLYSRSATYTVFIEEDPSNNVNNAIEFNEYRGYKKKLEDVSQILSEIKEISNFYSNLSSHIINT